MDTSIYLLSIYYLYKKLVDYLHHTIVTRYENYRRLGRNRWNSVFCTLTFKAIWVIFLHYIDSFNSIEVVFSDNTESHTVVANSMFHYGDIRFSRWRLARWQFWPLVRRLWSLMNSPLKSCLQHDHILILDNDQELVSSRHGLSFRILGL